MTDSDAEGWFIDPFGRHEQRWISDGRPTTLVRDGGVEGHDDPPDRRVHGEMVRAPFSGIGTPADVLRADDQDLQPLPTRKDFMDALLDGNLFMTSTPMGYQARLERSGATAGRTHWWMDRRNARSTVSTASRLRRLPS
jgi:hypothetical protein